MLLVFRTGLVGLFLALGPAPVLGQTTSIAGDWLGTSICVDRQRLPACKDEQVVYEARVNHNPPDTVVVHAHKVVNGQREFMGEYTVTLHEDGSWASEVRTARFHLLLKLQVAGDHMTGTLTDLAVGYRVRDIKLERAKLAFPDVATFIVMLVLLSAAVWFDQRRQNRAASLRAGLTVAATAGAIFGSTVALLGTMQFTSPSVVLSAFGFLTAFGSSLVVGGAATLGLRRDGDT